jgi:uncharacterized protein (TIGR03086 family)
MTSEPTDLPLLVVAVEQVADLLGGVDDAGLDGRTPCADWTVADLVDHVVNVPSHFATTMRGEEPDWAAAPPHVGADRVAVFRAASDRLVDHWRRSDAAAPIPLDWQLAELAVHTWDLATAVGEPTTALDPEVAQRGLAFMQANLTPDRRGPAFGPERPAPPDADAYARIAAYAGRDV